MINAMKKPVNDKRLFKNDLNRWQFDRIELSSGSPVELFIFDQWLTGRVEYDQARRAYVFLHESSDTLILEAGMKARLPDGARPRGGMI
jgi:hypothetical protein